MSHLILASSSPRRKEMLEWLELDFDVIPSHFDEDSIDCDDPVELVEELALQKALTVVKDYPEAIVIGADTMVELNGEVIGKANNETEAEAIIKKLAGTTHHIYTGVAIINGYNGEKRVESEHSSVTTRVVTPEELQNYLESGQWQGKAGAYAVQENPMKFVLGTEGSFTNIMGLPLVRVSQILEEMGLDISVDPEAVCWGKIGYRS